MNGATWRVVALVSRVLEPDERAAVRGDLAEAGASAGQALRQVTGLVIRREAALWMAWGPWLALAGVVVPLGALLSDVSRSWAGLNAVYAFLYVDSWTWGYLDSPGARRDLLFHTARFVVNCLTLTCWSWTSGFVMGALSRRTVWINGALFCLVVFAATLGSTARHNASHPVFSLTFYSLVFPAMMRTVFVLLPSLWGMYEGTRRGLLPSRPTILWAVVVVMLTTWTAGVIPLGPGLDAVTGTADDFEPLRLSRLVMVWPVAYMLATADWRGGASKRKVFVEDRRSH